MQYWREAIRDGKYNTAKMYTSLRGEKVNKAWRHMFSRNHARPRAIFITWLAFVGRLSTKDRILKYCLTLDPSCVYCGMQENMEHLYFECQTTGTVWKEILE